MQTFASKETSLLLSATAYLEQQWYRSLVPCLALQISRNYRLLQAQTLLPDLIKDYQQQAVAWFHRYELMIDTPQRTL
jgi:hypothetical protein